MVVTVVLSGMPQFVTLNDLAYNLDKLFDTDEIGTFKVRDLPDTDKVKRRIALDFRSGHDAMYAQNILDSKPYTLPDGVLKVLRARVTTDPALIADRSPTPPAIIRRCYRPPSSSSSVDEDIPVLKMTSKQLEKATQKMNAQLEALKMQRDILKTDQELFMEQAKLMRKLKKFNKKEKAKEKEKDRQSTKRPRSPSDGEIHSETDTSKKRRTGSSSRETRDTSSADVRESVSSDVRKRTPRNRGSSSDWTNSPSREFEEATSKKIIDLRNKIEKRALERKIGKDRLKRCSSDEASEKERCLRTPTGRDSRDRKDSSDRYVSRERDSDHYGHSSKDPDRYGHSSKDPDRYGHSSRDPDRYGHSSRSRESRRSPIERNIRNRRHDIIVERDRRRRSFDRGSRDYERSSRGRESEGRWPRGPVYKERYSRNEDERYASSSIVLYRRPARQDSRYRSSREREFKPGYNTKRNAITYKPESHTSIISDMNERFQKQKEYRNKKEEQAHMIKQEEELINSKTDEAVKDILKDNFSVINEMANKHRATDAEKKLVLPLLFRAIKGRFKSLLITSDLMVTTIIARYRCKYTRRIEDDLVSSLFKEIISARDKDKVQEIAPSPEEKRASDAADSDNEIDDMLQQLQSLASDVGAELEPGDERDDEESDDDEDDDRIPCRYNITVNIVPQNKEPVDHTVWTEVDNSLIEEPPNAGNVKITIDENRRKKYYITIRVLLKRLNIHIEKYRKYIDYKTFAYVVRMILEERIDKILVNKTEKLKAKDLYAYYRVYYPEENDDEFIRQLFYNTWNGAYNNVADPENNDNANTIDQADENVPTNNPTDDIQAVVKTEPVAEEPSATEPPCVATTSKESTSTNAPQILPNAEAVPIKKEPINETPVSTATVKKEIKSADRDQNVVVKTEPGTNVPISNNEQNKPKEVDKAPSIKKEPDSKESDKNAKNITDKRAKIRLPMPIVVKMEDGCNTGKTSDKIDEAVAPKEIIKEKPVAISVQVKTEPIVENSDKSEVAPVVKDETDGKSSEVAAKPAFTLPKPIIDIKPEVKPEIDDNDDIEYIGEYIEPNNVAVKTETEQPTVGKAQTSKDEDILVVESNFDVIDLSDTEDTNHEQGDDVLNINISNEGDFECAGVGQSQNLGKEFNVDISPNKTTTADPSTTINDKKCEQIGDSSTVEEIIYVSDFEIVVSDDEEAETKNQNKSDLEVTMEEQYNHSALNLEHDTASLDTVILDGKGDSPNSQSHVVNFVLNPEQNVDEIAPRQQIIEIVDIKVGRTNVSPSRGSDTYYKPRLPDQTEQPKKPDAEKNESRDYSEEINEGNGYIFGEDVESIESIQNFLDTPTSLL